MTYEEAIKIAKRNKTSAIDKEQALEALDCIYEYFTRECPHCGDAPFQHDYNFCAVIQAGR